LQPRISFPSLRSTPIHVACGALILLFWAVSTFAAQASRVVVREEIAAENRTHLLETLKVITGLQLSFDPGGALVLGEVEASGSASARNLLTKAVHGSHSIVVEEASNRAEVAFCRVLIRKPLGSTDLAVAVVQIDFEDFEYVIGDKKARASFNVGWGLLHEIDHVVSESEDTKFAHATGECEENINRMRVELGLPVRATYRFSPIPAPTDPAFITRLVRLGFVQIDSKRKMRKQYWLVWDASLVGGTDTRSQIAQTSFSR
jgi:hypothetical protein